MSITVSRVELYNQVWSTPISQLAKQYGLSDVGFAKVCNRNNVPRPPRGYWAKIQAGIALRKTSLPDPQNNQPIEFSDPSERPSTPKPPPTPDNEPKIVVAETLRGCHALVREANEQLQGCKTTTEKLCILPENAPLSVRVSKVSLRRSLLILDALLKVAESRGHAVDRGPTITVHGIEVKFAIVEKLDTIREETPGDDIEGRYQFRYNRYTSTRVPSGRLELTIDGAGVYWLDGCQGAWRDGKKQRIEEMLNRILAGIELIAERTKTHHEEARAEESRRHEARRQLEEKRARFAAERTKVETLLKQAKAWKESQDLRAYIEYARKEYLERNGAIDPGCDFDQWLSWAIQQADRLDPFVVSPPSILDEPVEEERTHDYRARYGW